MEKNKRIMSLDVFRGLTVALMIIVNSPGTSSPYPILDHAPWNGCTLADLVFPFFLFIVGLTSVVSLSRQSQVSTEDKRLLYTSIFRRTVILFALGLALNAIPHHLSWDSLRLYGVLQRIALCYFFTTLIYLNTSIKTQVGIFVGILWGYWALLTLIPVPGYGSPSLSEDVNWVGFIDQLLLSANHLYTKTFDPEGLLSTLPAIATTLSGVVTGSLLLSSRSLYNKCMLMLIAGCVCLLVGGLWGFSFPINKSLWTSSYVLWTSGWALILFTVCLLITDIWNYQRWALVFKVLGMNAIFVFVFHVLLLKMQSVWLIPLKNSGTGTFKMLIAEYLTVYFSQEDTALLFALVFLLFNILIAWFLYKRKWFLRL